MRKIKVLMLGNHQSVKGGITSVIQQLLSYDWDSVGVEMNFIPTYIEASAAEKTVYYIDAYKNIKRFLKTDKPDVVHIHMSYKGSFYRKYAIHKLCQKKGIPDIVHLHGSEFQKWYSELNERTKNKVRTMLRECSAFIVLGEKWDSVINNIEPKTKTVVVSNTVHIPNYTVKWNDTKFQILFLGVLIKRKGVEDLIRAIGLLKENNQLSNLRFVIAGTGAEEEHLRKLAKEQQIEQWTEFAGWTDGIAKEKYLKESQALVLPSYNEGLPIAVLEAISYGMPIIATDVGDMAAAVINDRNGFLVTPGNISELADRIVRLASDKEGYMRMSRKSKEISESKFSDTSYFKEILNCYKKAVFNG